MWGKSGWAAPPRSQDDRREEKRKNHPKLLIYNYIRLNRKTSTICGKFAQVTDAQLMTSLLRLSEKADPGDSPDG